MESYRPQLDSLRAIAVALVLGAHFWLPDLEISALGVRLFFVLSGFLLTSILLGERQIAEAKAIPRRTVLRDFYVRRILRIWPSYYATLIAAVLLGAGSIAATFAWHALFASNILFFLQQAWFPGMTSHLWTLAVEEQFYLLLPILILFLPRQFLRPVVVAAIAAAILYRGLVGATVSGTLDFYFVLPISQLDALGAGALLAITRSERRSNGWKFLLCLSLPFAALVYVAPLSPSIRFTFTYAVCLLPMVALVWGAAAGIGGALGAVLSNRWFVAIGRISYGIYLYHIFVAVAVEKLLAMLGGPQIWGSFAGFAVFTGATILVATMSWFLLERPALSLKRHFRRAAPEGTVVPAAPTAV